MKRFFTLITMCLLIGLGVVHAQNQRITVLECFTSATCGPCAGINPTLDNLIQQNSDKIIAIKYHVNWPLDNDPMNKHNPQEVKTKVSYYGIDNYGVPWSVGDGTWCDYSGSVSQNLINQWSSVPSPLEMRMTHYLNPTNDTITVIVTGRATSAINSSNLRLNVSIIESLMHYNTAPGTNGEKDFHNVFKKMLPNASGEHLAAMEAGDVFAYKYTWALANVLDVNQLTAVAWVQDYSTKEMFQGCKSQEEFTPFLNKHAVIENIDHTKSFVCTDMMNPVVDVTNLGAEDITSMKFDVLVNDVKISEIDWTGNITKYSSARINAGEVNFETSENNNIEIVVTQINGSEPDAAFAFSKEFEQAQTFNGSNYKLTLRTDDNPQNITWRVVNTYNGNIVASGGPYEQPNKQYTESFSIEEEGCYQFTIYDAGGDGLAGTNGIYGLKCGSKTVFAGSEFTDEESNEFFFEANLGVEENESNICTVYPNPSNGILNIETVGTSNVNIYNMAGQLVGSHIVNGNASINLDNISKGSYMMVVTNQNGYSSKQIIVLQ
ncbi:MAG: T9SS type A sorting domain-containing protein [Bacteroidales bacterium]|nr:T9SS type A sorting domain-containing protein [Bacteroidales bacterium]